MLAAKMDPRIVMDVYRQAMRHTEQSEREQTAAVEKRDIPAEDQPVGKRQRVSTTVRAPADELVRSITRPGNQGACAAAAAQNDAELFGGRRWGR